MSQSKSSFWALVQLLVFITIYLGTGIYLDMQNTTLAFYQLPLPVAMLSGIICAFMIFKESFHDKLHTFIQGCGQEDIITMCLIYLCAGAFSHVTKEIGGIDAIVNFSLQHIPIQFITIGIFLISSFISTATGTSVGAIVAIGPIAVGIAQKSGIDMPLLLACVLGGAMFGDNLSMISDTTIAATKTQNASMKDKFQLNALIALPAAIITIILIVIFGTNNTSTTIPSETYSIIKFLPYIAVLGLAITGMNVFLVLLIGILCSGIIGISSGMFDVLGLTKNIYTGFTNMTEIFLLSMFTGGLSRMIIKEGGIEWVLKHISKIVHSPKSALLGIGNIVSFINLAVANNTVAILMSGSVSKKISDQYHIKPHKTAAIMDIYSCCLQGIIPYGAQILILLKFTEGAVGYQNILPYLWYPILLLLSALCYISFTSNKQLQD